MFKEFNFLKIDDIISLNQTLFARQYKNKQLPKSFQNFFQDLPLPEQIYRDQDYNLKPKTVNKAFLSFYPSVQLIRAWNRNNLILKSEAQLEYLKLDFIAHKVNNYESDCLITNCYVCNYR